MMELANFSYYLYNFFFKGGGQYLTVQYEYMGVITLWEVHYNTADCFVIFIAVTKLWQYSTSDI